jgi:dihydroorotate dehydrogenase (NAD+) catalytic subunit
MDALEFVLAGASAVSLGTVLFNDPSAPKRVLRELTVALADRGFERLSDAVGYAHRPADTGPEQQPAEPEAASDDFGPDVDAAHR